MFDALAVKAVPVPFAAVFQPLNVYPLREKVFAAVVKDVPPRALPPVGAVPVPLLASYV